MSAITVQNAVITIPAQYSPDSEEYEKWAAQQATGDEILYYKNRALSAKKRLQESIVEADSLGIQINDNDFSIDINDFSDDMTRRSLLFLVARIEGMIDSLKCDVLLFQSKQTSLVLSESTRKIIELLDAAWSEE